LVRIVQSKFVVQKYKRLPPHLNSIPTLPCKTQRTCYAGKW